MRWFKKESYFLIRLLTWPKWKLKLKRSSEPALAFKIKKILVPDFAIHAHRATVVTITFSEMKLS